MIRHSRLATFSLAACITYTLAYYFDWPLFSYDLEQHSLRFFSSQNSNGPTILLYGWIFTAGLIALAIALFVPRDLGRKIPPDLLWLVPLASILAAVLYELRWFVQ